ncbi:hypothetical protein AHF37_11156 [Paragonimus kellicotti]|nr:hypothetical protein AHF37_11156 [Paragonimus kellicotti]
MNTSDPNKKTRKKKSPLKVSASHLEGVNNDSFEMEEIKPVPSKKEVTQAVKKIDEKKPKPQKRTKRHKTEAVLSTPDPSAFKGDHENDRSKMQQRPPDYDKIVGIVIHRADQLRISPRPGHLAVRIHMMDEKRRGYAVRQDADCVIPPAVTTPIEHVQGHIYLPVWEEMMLINERYSVVAHGSSLIFFFEILTLSTPEIPLNALRCSVTSKSVETIAWAFLRPVGANGHQNVGPKKQRLQLYEPVPDYNPLVSTTEQRRIALQNNQKSIMDRSNDVESRHDWQAVGEHLYAWWVTGTRVKYPSTLYVTVKKIDLEQLVKMNGSTDPFKMVSYLSETGSILMISHWRTEPALTYSCS